MLRLGFGGLRELCKELATTGMARQIDQSKSSLPSVSASSILGSQRFVFVLDTEGFALQGSGEATKKEDRN